MKGKKAVYPLHTAVRDNNADEVKQHLDRDQDALNSEDTSEEKYPLLIAIKEPSVCLEIVDLLLNKMTHDLLKNQKSKEKKNAFHYAVEATSSKSNSERGSKIFTKLVEGIKDLEPVLEGDRGKQSALELAARKKFSGFVGVIARKAEKIGSDKDWGKKNGIKAFNAAADFCNWDVVREFLKEFGDGLLYDTSQGTILCHAVRSKNSEIVQEFLIKFPDEKRMENIEKREKKDLKTILHLAAMQNDSNEAKKIIQLVLEEFDKDKSAADRKAIFLKAEDKALRTVLHYAAECCTDFSLIRAIVDAFPAKNCDTFISKRDKDLKTALYILVERFEPDDEEEEDELLEIVKYLIEKSPGVEAMMIESETKNSVYRAAVVTAEGSSYRKVSNFLMVQALRMKEIKTIRKILYGDEHCGLVIDLSPRLWKLTELLGKELLMDLSEFNDPSRDFNFYLKDRMELSGDDEDSMTVPTPERVLRSVKLPELRPRDEKNGFRKEAQIVLDWLQSRKVERILKIEVPDCLDDPHTDETIVSSLSPFKLVDHLIWRKRDLSIQTLLKAVPLVKNLHLYSSGNEAILSHWGGPFGLCRLKELRTVTIVVLEGLERTEILQQRCQDTERALINARSHHESCTFQIFEAYENTQTDYRCTGYCPPKFQKGSVRVSLEQAELIRKSKTNSTNNKFTPGNRIFSKELEAVQAFLNRFPRSDSRVGQRIKIAIIDCGVDLRPSIKGCIVEGQSFIEDDYIDQAHKSEWYIASDPHGTQMAYLICDMNQHCDLYIAKVCASRDKIDIDPVLAAIEWAKKRGVDIISMSLVFKQHRAELEQALNSKSIKVPLVFAATGDAGAQPEHSLPASLSSCFAISPSNVFGNQTDYAEIPVKQHFLFPGENILSQGPEYLKKQEPTIDGSSAATALAAGLASMILTLVRLAYLNSNDDDDDDEVEKKISRFNSQFEMDKLFARMTAPGSKLIKPSLLFNVFKGNSDRPDNELIASLRTIFDNI